MKNLKLFSELERYAHLLLGKLALQEGHLTYPMLLKALGLQRRSPHKKLGEILAEEGMMPKPDVQNLVVFQKKFKDRKPAEWPYIPDTVLKGLLYLGENPLGKIESKHIIQAGYLTKDRQKTLAEFFVEDLHVVTREDLEGFRQKIRTITGVCPRCSRNYFLFNYTAIGQLICPICQDAAIEFPQRPAQQNAAFDFNKTAVNMPAMQRAPDAMPAETVSGPRPKAPLLGDKATRELQSIYRELEEQCRTSETGRKGPPGAKQLGGVYAEAALNRARSVWRGAAIAVSLFFLCGGLVWYWGTTIELGKTAQVRDVPIVAAPKTQKEAKPPVACSLKSTFPRPARLQITGRAPGESAHIRIEDARNKLIAEQRVAVGGNTYLAVFSVPEEKSFWISLTTDHGKVHYRIDYPKKYIFAKNARSAGKIIAARCNKLEEICGQFLAKRDAQKLRADLDAWENEALEKKIHNLTLDTNNFGPHTASLQKVSESLNELEKKLRKFLLYQSEFVHGVQTFPQLLDISGGAMDAANLSRLGSDLWGKRVSLFRTFAPSPPTGEK